MKILSGLLVLILVDFFSLSDCFSEPLFRSGEPQIPGRSSQAEEILQNQSLPLLVKELSPAVVNISVEASAGMEGEKGGSDVPPNLPGQGNPFRSAGSGFIIRKDGYIVTCFHVIDKADKVIVRLLDDKEEYIAKVIGRDAKTDLALLKIDAKKDLPAVFIGDSDALQVGEWVVAIGNQFHLGQTVTTGIVSAKARKVPTKGSPYDSFIQTDASINPGSSGGPLFNAQGQVIGVNNAIFSPGQLQMGGTGFNIGIGFSVPVNLLKQIIAELESTGNVVRGMLGVRIQGVDNAIKKVLGLKTINGALVSEVIDGSPAARAGIKRRDVITQFDALQIEDFDQLPLMVANTKIGTKVELTVIRKGKQVVLPAVIEELKSEPNAPSSASKDYGSQIGISVEELTEIQAKALGLEGKGGLFVRGVLPGSTGERAGLKKGDLIEEIGDVIVTKPESLEKILLSLAPGTTALVSVRRVDGNRILTLEVAKK